MIVIEGLSKTYGKGGGAHAALRDVSLTIDSGEFVSIVGTSGSGKTTLLNVIGGLDRTWKGKVTLDGRELASMSDGALSELRNGQIGYVFQHFHLLDHLTCRENVMLPAYFGEVAEPQKRAEEVLTRMGLASKIDERPTALSGGQKQRVAIARALFNKPKLILCDEPTGSLDRATGVQILDLFRELNERDALTLIIVTHEVHVSEMAGRIITLEDGEVVSDVPNVAVRPEAVDIASAHAPRVEAGTSARETSRPESNSESNDEESDNEDRDDERPEVESDAEEARDADPDTDGRAEDAEETSLGQDDDGAAKSSEAAS